MALSAAELNALTSKALADPRVQSALQEWNAFQQKTGSWSPGHSISPYETKFYAALRATGLPVNDLLVKPDPSTGKLTIQNHGLPGWAYPVIIGAATAGGLGAAGAFAPAAAVPAATGAAPVAGTATGPMAGGLTPSFAVPSALASTTAATTPASGFLAHFLPSLVKAGAPAALSALTHNSSSIDPSLSMPGGNPGGGGGFGSGGSPLDAQLSELMDFSKRRMQQSEPVHQAAMQLALRMAPGTAGYGRVNEASQNAMHPVPQQQLNPQVLAALHHLMNGQGR